MKVTLEVLNPSNDMVLDKMNAPRLDTLNGKTVCCIWGTRLYRGDEIFPVLTDMLQKKYPTATIVPWTEMRGGNPVTELKEKGCDAVINGFGG